MLRKKNGVRGSFFSFLVHHRPWRISAMRRYSWRRHGPDRWPHRRRRRRRRRRDGTAPRRSIKGAASLRRWASVSGGHPFDAPPFVALRPSRPSRRRASAETKKKKKETEKERRTNRRQKPIRCCSLFSASAYIRRRRRRLLSWIPHRGHLRNDSKVVGAFFGWIQSGRDH